MVRLQAWFRAHAWGVAAGVGTMALWVAGVWGFWPIFCKLGLRACCYADWAGFCAAAGEALPGGVLRWAAHLGMGLWRVPLLGGAVMVGALGGLTLCARVSGRLRGGWGVLPGGLLLWQVAYCGFSCWIFANAAFPLHYALGWSVLLLVATVGWRWGAWGALGVVLWPVAGLPALAGVVLGALAGRGRWPGRLGRLVLALAVAVAWRRFSESDATWQELCLANSPFLFEQDCALWNVGNSLLLGALLGAEPLRAWVARAVEARWAKRGALGLRLAGWLVAALAVGGSCWVGMDPVRPLYEILACERAVERDDVAAILRLAPERAVKHRMLSAYTIYALWRSGQLEERLFDYPWRVTHSTSTIDTMELDGYRLLYRYGLVQLARRWCYESVINKEWSGEKYALLARIALVTEEPALARRYARQLARLPLWGKEASQLLALCEGRGQPEPELRRIHDLHLRLCADTGSPTFEGAKRLEEGIYNRYAVLKNGNRDMVGLYLCASLLRKDTTPLAENYEVILSVWPQRPLPRAFQQGYLEMTLTPPAGGTPPLRSDLFSPATVRDFEAFCATLRHASGGRLSPEQLMPRFGRSYWFYSRFVQ